MKHGVALTHLFKNTMKEIFTIKYKDIFSIEIWDKEKIKTKNIFKRYEFKIKYPELYKVTIEDLCGEIYKKSKKQKKYIQDREFLNEVEYLLAEEGRKKYLEIKKETMKKLIELKDIHSPDKDSLDYKEEEKKFSNFYF
jgi:RNA polymerase-interacting CarD/CdnL/TRCF family regulator